MGKRAPLRPSACISIDAMIAQGIACRVNCTRCGQWQEVDLPALRERMGGALSLWNRRTRCRLTPGCDGWNRFRHNCHGGFFMPMWDDGREWF